MALVHFNFQWIEAKKANGLTCFAYALIHPIQKGTSVRGGLFRFSV